MLPHTYLQKTYAGDLNCLLYVYGKNIPSQILKIQRFIKPSTIFRKKKNKTSIQKRMGPRFYKGKRQTKTC